MPERIHLYTGNCELLSILCLLVTALAAVGIATTTSPWVWKGSALLFLAMASWAIRRNTPKAALPGTGDLYPDGTASATLEGENTLLEYSGHAWVTRWFSIIAFRESDSGKPCSWLVCAHNNHPDDYRRMLGYLRLRSCAAGQRPKP